MSGCQRKVPAKTEKQKHMCVFVGVGVCVCQMCAHIHADSYLAESSFRCS